MCPDPSLNAISCGFDMPNVPFLSITESRITSQMPGVCSFTIVNTNGQVGPVNLQVVCVMD